jgi:DNA-binding NarL/FixJ family response regulator
LNMPNFKGKETRYAGLELLEQLKKLNPNTPVIVNSAWDEVETAKICLDQGAADYFVKGRTDEMLQKIRTVLKIS